MELGYIRFMRVDTDEFVLLVSEAGCEERVVGKEKLRIGDSLTFGQTMPIRTAGEDLDRIVNSIRDYPFARSSS